MTAIQGNVIAAQAEPTPQPESPTEEEKLGIAVQELTPELLPRTDFGEPGGVIITDVTRLGPASRRGIGPGAKILAINDEPIQSITTNGVMTEQREHEFDILICATGYDGITGAFDQIDFRGPNGIPLKDVWAEGQPRTYLGMLADGFPNMLMVLGPHTARGNIPQAIEHCVNFQAALLRFMREHDYSRVETRPEQVKEWTETVIKAAEPLL